MADDFNTKLNDFVDKASKAIQDGGRKALDRLDLEKQKSEIRSEIGHNSRDLTKAYEKLGRAYFEAKERGGAVEGEAGLLDLIRSKEKVIQLLHEKLTALEK